jgi:hypothetical protein
MAPSRIDRLLERVAKGESRAARHAAADELGRALARAAGDPSALIARIADLLSSAEWDARTGAARALGAFARRSRARGGARWAGQPRAAAALIGLVDLDMARVVADGRPLLTSGGVEFERADDSSLSAAQLLERTRQQLLRRLGQQPLPGAAAELASLAAALVSADDVCPRAPLAPPAADGDDACASTTLSARERNRLKRLGKKGPPISIRLAPPPPLGAANEAATAAGARAAPTADADGAAGPADADADADAGAGAWTLRALEVELRQRLFAEQWERRHGAVSALRALILATPPASAHDAGGVRAAGDSAAAAGAAAADAAAADAAAADAADHEDCAARRGACGTRHSSRCSLSSSRSTPAPTPPTTRPPTRPRWPLRAAVRSRPRPTRSAPRTATWSRRRRTRCARRRIRATASPRPPSSARAPRPPRGTRCTRRWRARTRTLAAARTRLAAS